MLNNCTVKCIQCSVETFCQAQLLWAYERHVALHICILYLPNCIFPAHSISHFIVLSSVNTPSSDIEMKEGPGYDNKATLKCMNEALNVSSHFEQDLWAQGCCCPSLNWRKPVLEEQSTCSLFFISLHNPTNHTDKKQQKAHKRFILQPKLWKADKCEKWNVELCIDCIVLICCSCCLSCPFTESSVCIFQWSGIFSFSWLIRAGTWISGVFFVLFFQGKKNCHFFVFLRGFENGAFTLCLLSAFFSPHPFILLTISHLLSPYSPHTAPGSSFVFVSMCNA